MPLSVVDERPAGTNACVRGGSGIPASFSAVSYSYTDSIDRTDRTDRNDMTDKTDRNDMTDI